MLSLNLVLALLLTVLLIVSLVARTKHPTFHIASLLVALALVAVTVFREFDTKNFRQATIELMQNAYSNIRVVISLTTHPTRVPKIGPCLQSLLSQDVMRDRTEVVVNLPTTYRGKKTEFDETTFPPEMRDERVRFRYVEDVGPATKVVWTGLDYVGRQNVAIVSVDDDISYKPYWLRILLQRWLGMPEQERAKTIVTVSGFDTIKNGQPSFTENIMTYGRVNILEGFGGVLYPSAFFEGGIIDWIKGVSRDCFIGDDFALSVWAVRRGISVVKTNTAVLMPASWELRYGVDSSTPSIHLSTNIYDMYRRCGLHVLKTGSKEEGAFVRRVFPSIE